MTDPAQSLWSELRQAGLVLADAPPTGSDDTPWYVRTMLGIAGWIAALFLLGFIGAAFAFIVKSEAGMVVVGLAAIGGAYALFRAAGKAPFLSQFGFAASLAGQALVILGLGQMIKAEHAPFWLIVGALEAVLAIVLPNFIHRVWSAFAAATALGVFLALSHAFFVTTGLLAALVLAAWLGELTWVRAQSIVRPSAYGLTLALLQAVSFVAFWTEDVAHWFAKSGAQQWLQPWMGEVLAAAALVVAVYQLLQRADVSPQRPAAMAALLAAALIGLVSLKAPGIAAGLMVLLLGFAGSNRVLMGLGIAALLLYLSAFYYTLTSTLLLKSAVLAGTGALLLLTRWAGLKWLMRESDHA